MRNARVRAGVLFPRTPMKKVRLKNLSDQVIVITGASSGIGLVTARMAAAHGAKLVLAARNDDALQELCDEIVTEGGEALWVRTDVGSDEEVRSLANRAMERYGRIDTGSTTPASRSMDD